MKMLALSWLTSLTALTGCALVAGAVAASGQSTESPQATPLPNTAQAAESAPAVAAPATQDKGHKSDARPGRPVTAQVAGIVKMTESGVGTAVIQAHVEQTTALYPPSAEEIIYLHNHGVSSGVITAFIRRGNELQTQAVQAARQSQAAMTQEAPPAPAPAPTVVQPAPETYPVYTYASPSYVYADYPSPSYAWSSYWSWPWYSYAPAAWYFSSYPGQHYRSVWTHPRSWSSGRGPWASHIGGGYAPPRGYSFGGTGGFRGHFGGSYGFGGTSGFRGHFGGGVSGPSHRR
jgi:hypothetical protein